MYEKYKTYVYAGIAVVILGIIAWCLWSNRVYDNGNGIDAVRSELEQVKQYQQSASDRLDRIEKGINSSANRIGNVSERINTNTERIVTVERRIEADQARITESQRIINESESILDQVRERGQK